MKTHLSILFLLGFVLDGLHSAQALEMIPTTYSVTTLDLDKMQCDADEVVAVKTKGQQFIMNLCRNEFSACAFEGTCILQSKNQNRILNVISTDNKTGKVGFAELNPSRCRYGLGMKDICLDPFFSVAVDLGEHQLGDVIFVPAIKGLRLPDGRIHDGHLIVRDGTRLLNETGPARLHFFTGIFKETDAKNVFAKKLHLDDPETRYPFEKVGLTKSQEIRQQRNYPLLPGVSSRQRVLR